MKASYMRVDVSTVYYSACLNARSFQMRKETLEKPACIFSRFSMTTRHRLIHNETKT